ncbi:MAG TPA: sigma-70 family RNA polymerase sigma factor [Herpetosiphonaceae bacterium]
MDDDLIQRAQAGDQTAFRGLVERYSTLVGRTARVLLADRMTAEEAAQDAWLDAWRNLGRFERGRPFRPWLLKLVINRCRMVARRRLPPSIPLDQIGADQLSGPAIAAAPATGLDADLAQALATLPIEQQRVVALRFFAELELAEIALVTGTRLGTVKSRLHRALAALRAWFEAEQTVLQIATRQENVT